MRILTIGDVGVVDDMIHLGDEAMLEALLCQFRSRGVREFTVVSANPPETSERYRVDAVARIDFSGARTPGVDAREARMDAVLRAARGVTGILDWQDQAWQVIEAVAGSDAVAIAGGGNLSSSWPEHIYERATIGELARIFNKPLVVSGQTIGPTLTGREGELVARLLKSARLVGVRERSSLELVESLGVEHELVRQTIDDAAFLGVDAQVAESTRPYCLVTFAAHTGTAGQEAFARLAAQLIDHIVIDTDLDIRMLGHVTAVSAGVDAGDAALHARIAKLVKNSRTELVTADSGAAAAQLARGAALSVSTRYHPSVFAASAGIPAIGISVDEYTDNKIAGALENFGQAHNLLPVIALFTKDAEDAVSEIWSRRSEIAAASGAVITQRTAEAHDWWDDLLAAASGVGGEKYSWRDVDSPLILDPALRVRRDGLREWMRLASRQATGEAIASREVGETIEKLRAEVIVAEGSVGEAHAELGSALERAADAEAALVATQELSATVNDRLFARRLSRGEPVPETTELQALLNTRTFRWTRFPRKVYSALRRGLLP